ncbi:RHS repeat-associated core domain-containing protein [Riemerella anatipestifer]|nr:RHS repeat-associated core domain-containing protein [Riemerella anatipestifer]
MATLNTQNTKRTFQDNRYTYDLVGNILQVENQVPIVNYALGGASNYQYQYDELNRLISATGTYTGEATSAEYQLQMQYNKLNGIVQKSLTHKQNGKDKGYVLDYVYGNKSHPHALSELKDSTTPKPRAYEYDGNGNPISYEGFKDFRVMVWDEENRLQGLNDNGKLHLYTYDHTGERAVKSSAESQKTVINGVSSAVIVHAENYTAYVNPYFVVNKGKFTKHYFEGTSRIVSKLGEGTFHQPTGLTAGGIDYIKQSAKVQEAIDSYIRGLNVPPGPPTQHGIYGTPDFTGVEYPSIDWSDISQDQEPPEGWPRPPKFNEPGDVPGPPVQYGDSVKPDNVKGGFGYVDNGIEEKNLYFYHPDHLGSSSYITDVNGDVNQHTEYMAFGEVLFDEHKVSRRMPYLFNGKELDSETGLYYYGARYYDPRVSIFLNVDPLAEKYPFTSPYTYTNNNPIMLIDPDGKEPRPGPMWNYYNILQGGSLRFIRKASPDSWAINTFFGSVNLPNPGATNFHILAVGFDEMVFTSHKQMAIYANAIDWDYFNETKHLRFNETTVYQGETYKIGKTPPTLSEIRDNVAALQELSCNCGAVAMGAMGASIASRSSNVDLPISNRIRTQKQLSEHIAGGSRLGNNSYLNSLDDATEVLNATNSGRVKILSTNTSQNRVYIEYKGVTGYYNNKGVSVPTNKFMIKGGGNNGSTVVPIHPKSTTYK